jgi:oxygen-independent coproporphyrinogen III oxidase
MDPALIRRYADQRLPRYTSYPTAPHFTEAVGETECTRWLEALDPKARLSLYFHVPFCRSLCWYCGCHTKVPGHDEPIARYVETLEAEIRLVAARLPTRLTVAHLHWGGGTPTIIGAARFARIMDLVREIFAVADDAELAIEIDPRRLDDEMVAALRAAGINRASLGVQSFDPAVQQAINRRQSFDATKRAVEGLRDAGITRLNFDLLYGLPHQTASSCEETVAQALTLAPDRLAVFGYAHLPSLKLHQRRLDEAALPDAVAREAQADAIATSLQDAGYAAIGLDHFARPDDALAQALTARRLRRNFQGYTTDAADALLGFGASSIGSWPQGYAQNAPQLGAYAEAVAAGNLPVARGLVLDAHDRLRRDIVEAIMCYLEVDLAALAARHGVAPEALEGERARLTELAQVGIVWLDGWQVRVAEDCRLLTRAVAAVFDTYLSATQARHARAI